MTAAIASILADLRLAVRHLRTTPAVSVALMATLAIGIGASTALFSLFNAMALRPLPVSDPDRLVTITSNTALAFGFRGGAGWNYGM